VDLDHDYTVDHLLRVFADRAKRIGEKQKLDTNFIYEYLKLGEK